MHKFKIVTLLSLLALGVVSSMSFAFASWQFNKTDSSIKNAGVTTGSWYFNPLPIEPGQTIVVDEDGNVEIDGVSVSDAEVSYPSNPSLSGGSVTMEIGVDDNGNLAVTEYSARDIASNWFSTSASLSLPESVEINGTTYPILGLSEPIDLDVGGVLLSKTISITVPEGYKYICDGAFADVTVTRNTTINFYLPTTLEYVGHHAFRFGVSKLTENIHYSGTKAEFKALIDASEAVYNAEHGSGYAFFYGATGDISISCASNTSITYNRYAQYKSGL